MVGGAGAAKGGVGPLDCREGRGRVPAGGAGGRGGGATEPVGEGVSSTKGKPSGKNGYKLVKDFLEVEENCEEDEDFLEVEEDLWRWRETCGGGGRLVAVEEDC